jgi:hypothetical protein
MLDNAAAASALAERPDDPQQLKTIIVALLKVQPPAPATLTSPSRFKPFFTEFGPKQFKKKNGEPVKHRALLNIAKRLQLPLIYAGGEAVIDVPLAEEIIANHRKYRVGLEPERPRRGRPRALGG